MKYNVEMELQSILKDYPQVVRSVSNCLKSIVKKPGMLRLQQGNNYDACVAYRDSNSSSADFAKVRFSNPDNLIIFDMDGATTVDGYNEYHLKSNGEAYIVHFANDPDDQIQKKGIYIQTLHTNIPKYSVTRSLNYYDIETYEYVIANKITPSIEEFQKRGIEPDETTVLEEIELSRSAKFIEEFTRIYNDAILDNKNAILQMQSSKEL